MKKQIPLFKVYMSNKVSRELESILYSGYIGEGSKVIRLEEKIAEFLKIKRSLVVNSGTSALHLACHMAAYRNSPRTKMLGGEVISTPMTCTATNTPIICNGLKIKWADVDPLSGNINPLEVEKQINKNTRAIMAVHWGGAPCKLSVLEKISKEYNIPLIQDCAHAFSSTYCGKDVSTFGDFSCYSFQAIKHVTSGDGGALICNNKDEDERARLLKWFGIDRNDKSQKDLRCEADVKEAGYKFHMNDINATIGLVNLSEAEQVISKHRENARFYNHAFRDIDEVETVELEQGADSAYWLYTIHVKKRDKMMSILSDKGIMTSKVHSRNDTHSMFKDSFVDLSGVESFNSTHLCIPVGWWVTQEDREMIADTIIKTSKKIN